MGLRNGNVDLEAFGKSRFPKTLKEKYPFILRGIVLDDDEDGDNVRVLLDRGFGDRTEASIRMLGHSAAERRSRDPFERWLGERAARSRKLLLYPNRPVGVRSEVVEENWRMSFTRVLGYIEISGSDSELQDASEVLLAGGTPGIWPSSTWAREGMPPEARAAWAELYEREREVKLF